MVEQQSSMTNKNYASIIKSAGTQVKLVDAMMQTDETYDVQIKKQKQNIRIQEVMSLLVPTRLQEVNYPLH